MNNIYTVTELNGSTREIIAQQSFVEQYYPGRWVLVGPENPVIPSRDSPTVITRDAMVKRFTDAENDGFYAAVKTDAEVESWVSRFYSLANINVELKDPRTVADMNMMVSKGLLTQVRANAILNDPVQESERPA